MEQGIPGQEDPSTASEPLESAFGDFVIDWRKGEYHPLEYYVRDLPLLERDQHLEKLKSLHQQLMTGSTVSHAAEEDSEKVPVFLNGRYEPRSLLGTGSFGEVWCAYDARLKRYVAVKLLRSDRRFSERAQEEFLKEGERLAQLSHPGIVMVFDVGVSESCRYIVSELIQGMTLLKHQAAHHLSLSQCVELVIAIAEALHHAHLRNVVHRDLKPANIMVDQDGRPRILDFGLATTEMEQLEESSQILGTYPYMSPEQVRGESHLVDARTDIYSLGVILYELLTQRRPFEGRTPAHFTEQILRREPRPLRTINDSIPRELEAVCLKCLEKDPKNRYSSCRDLASSLERFCQLANRKSPRLRSFVGFGAAVLMLLCLSAAFWNPILSRKDQLPEKALLPPGPQPAREVNKPNELTISSLWTSGRGEVNRFEVLEPTNELQIIARDEVNAKAGVLDEETRSLEVTIDQMHWPGNVGLILGYMHPATNGRHRFHRVNILRMQDGSYRLRRYTPRIVLDDPWNKSIFVVENHQIEIQPGGNRLAIHFEDGYITRVDWNGEVLEENSTPVDDRPDDELMTGTFGFFTKSSTSTFSSIRINGQLQKLIER